VTDKVKRKSLPERLKAGLDEAIRFAKGELSLRTVQVPLENESLSNKVRPTKMLNPSGRKK